MNAITRKDGQYENHFQTESLRTGRERNYRGQAEDDTARGAAAGKKRAGNAYAGFDNATDPDLIDCYIFELNAVMKRYKYLLQKAAESDPLPGKELAEAYRPLTLS